MKKFLRGRVKKVNVITRAQIQNRVVGALLAFIFASTLIYTVVGTAGEFGRFANDAAVLSAKLSVPQGGSEVWADDINYLKGLFAPPRPHAQAGRSTVIEPGFFVKGRVFLPEGVVLIKGVLVGACGFQGFVTRGDRPYKAHKGAKQGGRIKTNDVQRPSCIEGGLKTMGKMSKKRGQNKRHFVWFGGDYLKATKKSRAAKLAAGVIIFTAVLISLLGILTADHNSRAVGWNYNQTELAFAISNKKLDITVMGHKLHIDTAGVSQAGQIYANVRSGLDYLEPAPLKLVDMLYLYIREKSR
jgi:hypothetical protein